VFTKFAAFEVLSAVMVPEGSSASQGDTLVRTSHRAVFDYDVRPGYLYVRSRAISSRCNDNFDEFPAEEIKTAYKTFVGKPVFVNHHNDNHRRARGVIIDAVLHEDKNPDGTPDTWAEVLMEVDAVRFPKLAEAVLKGHIARTSMGTDVAHSICSACGNKATSPAEYCAHIPRMKGQRIYKSDHKTGSKEGVLVREICYGLGFFENSLLVEEPADPTAFFTGVDTRGLAKAAARDQATCPHTDAPWTAHDQCPSCGAFPMERDHPCTDPWCVENEPEHDERDHIDPSHRDEGHEDYASAKAGVDEVSKQPHIQEGLSDLDIMPHGPSKYSLLQHFGQADPDPIRDEQTDVSDTIETGDMDLHQRMALIQHFGGKLGDAPEGLKFHYLEPGEIHATLHRNDSAANMHSIIATVPGDDGLETPVGHLHWSPSYSDTYQGYRPGEVSSVLVHPKYRRRGIADAMMQHGQQLHQTGRADAPPVHSDVKTGDGMRWSDAVSGDRDEDYTGVDRHARDHFEEQVKPKYPPLKKDDFVTALFQHFSSAEVTDDDRANHARLMDPEDSGFSHHPVHGKPPEGGYVFSASPTEHTPSTSVHLKDHELTPERVAEHRKLLQDNGHLDKPGWYQGGWREGHTGETDLDLSYVTPDHKDAYEQGLKHRQKAYFDLNTFKDMYYDKHRDPDYMSSKDPDKYKERETWAKNAPPEYMAYEREHYKDAHTGGLLEHFEAGSFSFPYYGGDEPENFLRNLHEDGARSNEMQDHSDKRIVDTNDEHDLKSHMMESHGWSEGDHDFHRNTHGDHPALGKAPGDDRKMTSEEVGKMHDWEHQAYEDWPGATTLGGSHFHTASRKTASEDMSHFEDQVKGVEGDAMGAHLWEGINQIFDPGSSEESRESDRNIRATNKLLEVYPPHQIKHDAEDIGGAPYAKTSHPSGWFVKDYSGPHLNLGHEATGEEDEHDVIPVGHPDVNHPDHTAKYPGFTEAHARQHLDDWVKNYGADYAPHADKRIVPWQKKNGYTA
jgi:GNAT superfamily N-acetyltransferase